MTPAVPRRRRAGRPADAGRPRESRRCVRSATELALDGSPDRHAAGGAGHVAEIARRDHGGAPVEQIDVQQRADR